MSSTTLLLPAILIVTVAAQALLPAYRLLCVSAGAAAACLVSAAFGVGTTRQILADVPWDVIVLLIGLGFVTEIFAATRVFGVLAARISRWSRGEPRLILVMFSVAMYLVSALVNNLTALLLVLPILLILLKLLGVSQRYVSWTLGSLLVACNLGGAATPIGDFPAILLLGRGVMTFSDYLVAAAPPTLVALAALLLFVHFRVRPERGLPREPVATRLSLAVMDRLHRGVRIDLKLFVPAAVCLVGMLVAWVTVPASSGVGPELICWLGVGAALMVMPRIGERIVRTKVDVEAVLFLVALFTMVAAVKRSGVFEAVANGLTSLAVPPTVQLVLFLFLAGALTGLFSAGPSMAALLEVAQALAVHLPPTAVYVGLALSVCAGSSLFLTAATSGPMAQMLTERADLRDANGKPLRFGFFHFVPVGVVAFAIIQGIGIAYALLLVGVGELSG